MLYFIDQWLIYPVSILALIAAAEAGQWLGRRRLARPDAPDESQIGTLQSALLGLLALMIGFTFSMALTRYDARRQLVLDEANAIGTTWLRAGLLPAPQAAPVRGLLKDYVDARMEFHAAGADPARLSGPTARSASLQTELWRAAEAASAADPHALAPLLFIQSLNDVIDLGEKRLTSIGANVPQPVIVLLYAVAALALGFTGYAAGLAGKRNPVLHGVLAVAIATVILLVTDLDRPQRGLITVGQEPMERLAASIRSGGP